jgi:N-acetylglutamate synthase-like GNAT family acetyltransferase
MILKIELTEQDWEKLVDMYDETNMFLGLGRNREIEKIRRAYEKSYKYVVALEDDIIIGAARMISDGECYGWIHDVAVLEAYRRQGVGKRIMEKLLEGNDNLLIGLTSSFMATDFYSELGFKRHKTAMAKYPGPSDYLCED